MTEKLLHFIWQHQYFNTNALETESKEPLQIICCGNYNSNQGADFLNATIKIGNIKFAGNIEMHVKASDWHKHKHSADKNYTNVILHVVWQNDAVVTDKYSNPYPTLVIAPLVPKIVLKRYEQLMNDASAIHCKKYLPALSEIGWIKWKETLAIERLQTKSEKVFALLKATNRHWEEVFWRMIAANFGMKVNSELFEQIAATISINILAKHKNQIHQLEAMLLGQANLLNENFSDDYPLLLKKEYQFLQKKYRFASVNMSPQFLRMRPANFPTIRLAQLAMLIHQSTHLFSTAKELQHVTDIENLLSVSCNDYWHYHYRFDEPSTYLPKRLGTATINTIIINTIVPVVFAYGVLHQDEILKEKALNWLLHLKAESNAITDCWRQTHIRCNNALESQAMLQLIHYYCYEKKCLQCAVANKILQTTSEKLHPA
jgi:hypothetical protein